MSSSLGSSQGDSEKPDFFVSCDDRDSFCAIILDYFDRSCRRFCDAFKQGQGATGEREDILRRMVRTVCVAIFSQCDVLVSMHDFNLPMISIEPQNGFWCGRCHTGYQIGNLRFAFRDLAFADMIELRPYFRTGSLLTLGGHFPSHIFKSLFWGFVSDA